MPTDKEKKISIETLRELLNYNPETGVLTWKPRDRKWFKSDRNFKWWNGRFSGAVTGSDNADGYLYVGISATGVARHTAHRIAWALHYGAWPADGLDIDHINGNRADNRIDNLRTVTRHMNSKNQKKKSNNISGINGISVYTPPPKNGAAKWQATVRRNGSQVVMRFPLTEAGKAAAIAWRKEQISKIGGYTDRHGR